MKKTLLILLCSAALGANAANETLKNSATLYLPFDGIEAKGSGKNLKLEQVGSGTPVFAKGKVGNALAIDGEGVSIKGLKLTGKEFCNGAQGTLCFWMRPLVDYPKETKRSYFFYWENKDAAYAFIDKGGEAGFFYQTRQGTKWVSPHFSFGWWKRPQWSPDSWYHIAITWAQGKPTIFYVNGVEIFRTNDSSSLSVSPETAYIGCSQSGENSANALLDELFIFPRPLTSEEIRSIL